MKEADLFRAHGLAMSEPAESRPSPAVLDHVRRVDGHWVWAGPQTLRGHGTFDGKLARRAVWEATNGPIPDGFRLVQTCDLPHECLLHLQPVSAAEAIRLMTVAREAGAPPRTTARMAEFRARRVHAVSTSIPHVASSPVAVVRRLSTAIHARNGQLSTTATVRDDDYGFASQRTTNEEDVQGDDDS